MRYSIFSVNDHHPRLPRTVPQLYRQVIHSCELAERLGFDTFFCAEHHFHEYGVVPDPAGRLLHREQTGQLAAVPGGERGTGGGRAGHRYFPRVFWT